MFTIIAVTIIVVFVLAAVGFPILRRRRRSRANADSVQAAPAAPPGGVQASGREPPPPVDPGGGPAPASHALAETPSGTAKAASAPTPPAVFRIDRPENSRPEDHAPAPADRERASLPG